MTRSDLVIPQATVDALYEQYHQHGVHLVVAGGDKGPCECNGGHWKYPPPDWDCVERHIESCPVSYVGVVPFSGDLKATVLDIDRGDPDDVLAWREPKLKVGSERPGRAHFWYADSEPRGNNDWSLGDAGGEVRSGNGYVIQTYDPETPIRIVEEFLTAVHDLVAVDLFSLAGLEILGDSKPVVDVAEYSGMVDGDGRNQKLFADLTAWARDEVLTHRDKGVFAASVASFAYRLNGLFDEPETSKRVGSIIRSVVDFAWQRRNAWLMSSLPLESKVLGGKRSGSTRMAKRDRFDAQVATLLSRGYKVPSIAVVLDRHERTVYQAQARIRSSTESNTGLTESNTESNTGLFADSVTFKAGFN